MLQKTKSSFKKRAVSPARVKAGPHYLRTATDKNLDSNCPLTETHLKMTLQKHLQTLDNINPEHDISTNLESRPVDSLDYLRVRPAAPATNFDTSGMGYTSLPDTSNIQSDGSSVDYLDSAGPGCHITSNRSQDSAGLVSDSSPGDIPGEQCNQAGGSMGSGKCRPVGPSTPACFFDVNFKGYTRSPDWPTVNDSLRDSLTAEQLKFIKIYDIVRQTNKPNFLEARQPLPGHTLNISAWRSYVQKTGYRDNTLCDHIEFGFPFGFTSSSPPVATTQNHKSATDFPTHVKDYIDKELARSSMIGPFTVPLFHDWFQTSPLLTREKKDSDQRRVIMNLSWPPDFSVNDGVPSTSYMDIDFKLSLPTIDHITDLVLLHGPGCNIYKQDIKSAFRNLRSDPLDWPLMGLLWESDYFCDLSIAFGSRHGTLCMQRCLEAVNHFLKAENYDSVVYVDDIIGIHKPQKAQEGFYRTSELLDELGLPEAIVKQHPPDTQAVCLGIEVDTVALTKSIPRDKLQEIIQEVQKWINKKQATRHELQQLTGKLLYIAKAVKGARLFINRILEDLRRAPQSGYVTLSAGCQSDLDFFISLVPFTNGVSLIHKKPLPSDRQIAVDSSIEAAGGICGSEYYHELYPDWLLALHYPICYLECLNMLIAFRVFAPKLAGHTVTLFSDNMATISVLQTSRGHDPFLVACARQIWLLACIHDIDVHPHHKPGAQLVGPDALSRVHMDVKFQKIVDQIAATGTRIRLSPAMFSLPI